MNKLFQISCALIFLAVLFPVSCSTFIEPSQIGVRQTLTGGVVEEDFTQERVMDLPLFHTIHYLPRDIQFLHYLRSQNSALSLRTKGNNDIFVDVSVQYRIIEGSGYKIVREGIQNSLRAKVDSACQGFLREHLGQLTNEDVQKPRKKEAIAASAVEPLNKILSQYHVKVVAVNLRAVQFSPKYEAKLMEKQIFVVQGELDTAKENESAAIQATDTVLKGIERDKKIEAQAWRAKSEAIRTKYQVGLPERLGTDETGEVITLPPFIGIAAINAAAIKYDQEARARADALCKKAAATGNLAEANARALGERLKAQALATPAGETYVAIQAARAFQLGDVQLNSANPKFLHEFGSMSAWREFFTPTSR